MLALVNNEPQVLNLKGNIKSLYRFPKRSCY